MTKYIQWKSFISNIVPKNISKVNMKIISKKDAKNKGLKRFFTGKPCKRGHIAERMVSTHDCLECKKEVEKERYHQTGGKYHKDKYQEKREEKIAKQMKRQTENHEEYLSYQKQWRDANKERIAQYRKDNADKYAYHTALRKKKVKQATPHWFEEDQVKAIYEECARISKETGIPHEVDHIIPLKNNVVCGLHCIDNLQILSSGANRRKRNTFKIK